MKIISLSYYDKTRNWGFDNLELFQLTLLVGASGVGKTQILQAIMNLKRIARGESLNGIKWDVTFGMEGQTYNWRGEFEDKVSIEIEQVSEREKEGAKIFSECLAIEGKVLIDRNADRILFKGKQTVKLSSTQSAIYLLREETDLESIYYTGFWDINEISCYNVKREFLLLPKDTQKYLLTFGYIHGIRLMPYDILSKLYAVSQNCLDDFNAIKRRYASIFPQVEDIKFAPLSPSDPDKYYIQIKEKGVGRWISQQEMSSGMYRSLMQICELYLCADGSVLLMDEFENSLGINCIDELTNDILSSKRDIQFILTSHHPYIINNIPYQNWKIVTRKAGNVNIKDATAYRIGESKHDAFMQLIQLEDFSNGID